MKTKLISLVNKTSFTLRKHSPQILIIGGVVGVITSSVLACRATTKLNGILQNARNSVDEINKHIDDPSLVEPYTAEDAKRDQILIYTQTGLSIVKLYAPAVILGALSITGILASNNIMRARTAGLAAAYLTIDKAHKDYRKRVIDRYGEKADYEIRNNIKTETIEEIVVDENGKEKKVKKTIEVAEENEYSCFFDQTCPGWDKNSPESNVYFLQCVQSHSNEILRGKGYLFLNDVYDQIGIPQTKAGQVVGWIYSPDNPVGDNFVDFGIYDIYKETVSDFIDGYEPAILLNFNVDGPIMNRAFSK